AIRGDAHLEQFAGREAARGRDVVIPAVRRDAECARTDGVRGREPDQCPMFNPQAGWSETQQCDLIEALRRNEDEVGVIRFRRWGLLQRRKQRELEHHDDNTCGDIGTPEATSDRTRRAWSHTSATAAPIRNTSDMYQIQRMRSKAAVRSWLS